MVHQRGFTLIEIAVVLAIVGILATIAAPNLTKMRDNMRVKGMTTDISSMIRAGRSAAMQENVEFALVVRTGTATDPSDDRAVLLRCPPGTAATYNFTTITQAMMDGSAAYPAGFTQVRAAELVAPTAGIGPGSQGILTISAAYASINRTTGCSFCTGGVGAIVFLTDGELAFSDDPINTEEGSVTVSYAPKWPTPTSFETYTITVRKITGEVRVWH